MTRINQAQLRTPIVLWENESVLLSRHRTALNSFERNFQSSLKSWLDSNMDINLMRAVALVKNIARETMSRHKQWHGLIDWREKEEFGLCTGLELFAPTQGYDDCLLTLSKKEVNHV